MADTKLTNAKIPDMKPKPKSQKLGLLTKGKRKMASYRMRYETIELLDTLVNKGKKQINNKISASDIIEAALYLLSATEKETFKDHCMNYLNKDK